MHHLIPAITLFLAPIAMADDNDAPAHPETNAPTEEASEAAEQPSPSADAATESTKAKYVDVSFGDVTATKKVTPRWPEAGKNLPHGGTVCEVTSFVDATGTPERAVSICGLWQFERAATHAAMKWRFEPHMVDGVATPFKTKLKLTFSYNKKK